MLLLLAMTICGHCFAERTGEPTVSGKLSVIPEAEESKDVCRVVAEITSGSDLKADDFRLLVDGSEPLEPLSMELHTENEPSEHRYTCIFDMDLPNDSDQPLSISICYGNLPLDEYVIHPPKLQLRTYSLLTAGFFLLSLFFLILMLYCGKKYRRIHNALIDPVSSKSNLTLRGNRADKENTRSDEHATEN